MLNWIRDLFEMYPNQPKFSFVFHSQYSHDTNNRLPYADDELVEFLKLMYERGYFDQTILIIMSDHGARFSSLRQTYQGKLEERLPFLSIRMPEKFQESHPEIMENLRINSHRLTTPFDLHETFEHLFEFHSPEIYQAKSNRSHSLFQLIPSNRTCLQAGIEQHWCACLHWNDLPSTNSLMGLFAEQAVRFLNDFIGEFRDQCAQLHLVRIQKAFQLETNERLLKFVDSSDKDGRVPRFFNKSSISGDPSNIVFVRQFYQIQFQTGPGDGLFELTAEYHPNNQTFLIEKKRLSRMNKYGDASSCIALHRPELREVCFCKIHLNSSTTNANLFVKNVPNSMKNFHR